VNKILIVEDESLVVMDLTSSLAKLGYEVAGSASNHEEAISLTKEKKPDLILMDICLNGKKDGIQAAKEINRYHDIPIVYLTALDDTEVLERALKTNPCAYLTKPFSTQSLKASIEIALRKKESKQDAGDIIFDEEFSYNSNTKELVCNDKNISLTKRERELLSLLVENRGQVVTFDEMESAIWPDKLPNDNTRRALVSRLRAKLKYKFIKTIPSLGYKIVIAH
jgi:DNA-binding response OmpR family regulator